MDDATLQAVVAGFEGKTVEEIAAMLAESGRVSDPEALARFIFAKVQGLL